MLRTAGLATLGNDKTASIQRDATEPFLDKPILSVAIEWLKLAILGPKVKTDQGCNFGSGQVFTLGERDPQCCK